MIVPTLYLQIGLVACLLTAGVCGHLAERHRDATYGVLCVLSLFSSAALFAVLAYRGTR